MLVDREDIKAKESIKEEMTHCFQEARKISAKIFAI